MAPARAELICASAPMPPISREDREEERRREGISEANAPCETIGTRQGRLKLSLRVLRAFAVNPIVLRVLRVLRGGNVLDDLLCLRYARA